jgi:hypothetical protein
VRLDADFVDTRIQGVAQALALRPGQCAWYPTATYHRDERVPIALLGIWAPGYAEPWYLATTLPRADWAALCYQWRMRIECANRDAKTGVLLREGDDHHALQSLAHLHRLLLVVCLAEWLCALVGLQAWQELSTGCTPLEAVAHGPAQPPPVVPHRGPPRPLPGWMRRFAARGPLSYVRLGLEVLRAPDRRDLLGRRMHWLAT